MPAARRQLRAIAADVRPDWVISPDVQTLLLSASILRTRRALFLQSGPERLMRHGLAGRFVDRHLDRVLCCSRFIAECARLTPVDAAKIAIVPKRLAAAAGGRRRRAVEAGIVGRIVSRAAWSPVGGCALLQQLLPDAFASHVGTRDGPFAAELESRIAALGLGDIVRWTGFLADRDRLYGELDILVAPAVGEPFGLTVPEAGSYGLPVVAARSGAFPELIEEERTGLLFEPGDASGLARALERLVGDAALRRRLGEAARAHVGARFTIENRTERFLSLHRAERRWPPDQRVPIAIIRMSLENRNNGSRWARRELHQERAGQGIEHDRAGQRLAHRPQLLRLARRQAAIVLLGQARRAVPGREVVAVIGVDGIAIAIGDHDVTRRHSGLAVATSDALTLALALPLSLPRRVVVAMPLAGRSDPVGRTAAAAGLVVLLRQRGLNQCRCQKSDKSGVSFKGSLLRG